MLIRVDLTLDCANPEVLAEFWKTAAGYVDEPPPAPFTTRDEWFAKFAADEDDDGMGAAWLHDPNGVAPRLCLLQVPEPKTAKTACISICECPAMARRSTSGRASPTRSLGSARPARSRATRSRGTTWL